MSNEKILIVGGTFNCSGGQASSLVEKLAEKYQGAMIINGGMVDFLKTFLEEGSKDYDVIYWLPEESTEIADIENIRALNKNSVIINKMSKSELTDEEIADVLEKNKANLMLEVSETEDGKTFFDVVNLSGKRILASGDIDSVRELTDSPVVIKEAFKKKPIPEQIIEMERLHLRVFDDSIDILYRPNHNYIAFVKNDENGRGEVKRLAEMSREEFAKYLSTKSGLHRLTKADVLNLSASKAEEWYKSAWKMQTDKLIKELSIANPIEEPIWRG